MTSTILRRWQSFCWRRHISSFWGRCISVFVRRYISVLVRRYITGFGRWIIIGWLRFRQRSHWAFLPWRGLVFRLQVWINTCRWWILIYRRSHNSFRRNNCFIVNWRRKGQLGFHVFVLKVFCLIIHYWEIN